MGSEQLRPVRQRLRHAGVGVTLLVLAVAVYFATWMVGWIILVPHPGIEPGTPRSTSRTMTNSYLSAFPLVARYSSD
jgi:hypothetical protein